MIHSDSQKLDPKIKIFSELYFADFVQNKGIERFKKERLDNINYLKPRWLEDAFARLAEKSDCKELKFDYDSWLEFKDEGIFELLYQIRLTFAELYRKQTNENKNQKSSGI
ncbi:MAG: hypothetical protein LBU81_04660 [Methanosarcinales archaeon]|jgi:hypothetical protein|nr:hypothetical protein [Methanosarcinales archaeon]